MGGSVAQTLFSGKVEFPASGSTTIERVWTDVPDGEHVVEVRIEPTVSQSTSDDDATRGLRAGTGQPATPVDVSFNIGGTCGGWLSASGLATYAGTNGPVPTGCAAVTATLYYNPDSAADPNGWTQFSSTSGARTNAFGAIRTGTNGSATAGDYRLEIMVDDGTLVGTGQQMYHCDPPGVPDGSVGVPPPPSSGEPSRDVYLYAEDIAFLGDPSCTTGLFANPEPGDDIGVLATIRYYGPDALTGQSVVVSELIPNGGGFITNDLDCGGSPCTVDLPAGGGIGQVCIPYTPQSLGARIIQVQVFPSVTQPTLNDAATKAISVGTAECTLDLSATSLQPLAGQPASLTVTGSDATAITTVMSLDVVSAEGPLSGLTSSFDPASPLSMPFAADLTVSIDGTTPAGRHLLFVVGQADTCSAVAAFAVDVPLCQDQDADGYGYPGQPTCPAGAEPDCNDGDASINPAAVDLCNGVDDNCSGAVDEDFVPTATSCGTGTCEATGSTACVSGSIVDLCTPGTPAASDAVCDGLDEDCDGTVDEDYVSTTTSCGIGACGATGSTSCVAGTIADSCTPGTPAPSDALCDGVDEDCDGTVDEDYVSTTTSCGIGACGAAGSTSCVAGTIADSCTPGTPAPSDALCDGVDEDCDGTVDEDYVSTTTSCGIGACGAAGSTSCVAGTIADSCTPGTPAPDDATCDGVDDDCNGTADEDFVSTPTSCGGGSCIGTGETQCDAGDIIDTCQPPTVGATEVCNGQDDDCDGIIDEGTLDVRADIHTIGAGSNPGSTKTPYAGLLVGIYDKSDTSCARTVCGGISWQEYACIVTSCQPVMVGNPAAPAEGPTDADGHIVFELPPGNYLAIGSDGTEKHLGISVGDVECNASKNKYLQRLDTADGKHTPARTSVRTGSELLVIEPEFIEWTGTQEAYPFVFESLGDWSVTASVTPPDGFVSDYEALSTEVSTDTRALQFTITDVGSDWVPAEVRHTLLHGARKEIIRSRVGVKLDPTLAAQKHLDQWGHRLDAQGDPIPEPGLDPRAERPAELIGWIEPSAHDANWTLKVRVNTTSDVLLMMKRGNGDTVRELALGRYQPGEYAIEWDGRDATGRKVAPGSYAAAVSVDGVIVDAAYVMGTSRQPRQSTTKDDPLHPPVEEVAP